MPENKLPQNPPSTTIEHEEKEEKPEEKPEEKSEHYENIVDDAIRHAMSDSSDEPTS